MKHRIALWALCLVSIGGLARCGGAPGTQFNLQDPSDKREFFCTLAKTQNTPELEAVRRACESELGEVAIDAAIEQVEQFVKDAMTQRCAQ